MKTISGIKVDGGVPKRFIPDPPFLVPAILDTLRSQDRYRHLTALVPGEADPYCADDVKQNGGILLTSDSDLLLYDLGPTGSVVFLKDLQIPANVTEGGSFISALMYKQSELCRRMSLAPGQMDMLRFGFEMTVRPCHNIREVPKQSAWAYLDEAHAEHFANFVAEYEGSPNLAGSALHHRSALDPRISEFVLGWEKATAGNEVESSQDLTVWLPSLADRWDQSSAWDPGTTIRQLAYSLCYGSNRQKSTVMEHRRTLSIRSAGEAVELLDKPQALGAIDGLVDYVDWFVAGATAHKGLQWIATCLSLEIVHAAQEGKESNALGLWRKAAASEGALQSGDWDAVHLAAQILGTLYSFRMLQQVLTIAKGGPFSGPMSSSRVGRLEEQLSSLPSLAEFPAAADMKDIFARLHQDGQLEMLAEATGVPGIPFGASGSAGQRLKGRQKKTRTQRQKQPHARASQPQASTNPFAALSTAN